MFGGLTPRARFALGLAATALAYFVAAKLSLSLALVGESVTPLWPPTGIALVAFLVLGSRVWPAVTVAAFLVNLPISPTSIAAAVIAIGNTAAPLVGAMLLRRAGFRPELDRTRDAIALVLLGALSAMTISATVGSLALELSGALASASFAQTWAVWWAGDAMGILAIAPFLLSNRRLPRPGPTSWANVIEGIAAFSALLAASSLLSLTDRPVWVTVFPLLLWITWRYGLRGATSSALLVIAAASWAAAEDAGPFAGAALGQKMLALQAFNVAVASTSFFFAAVVAERAAARRDLDRSARELYLREHRVAETLQRSLLLESLPSIPDLDIAARYIPATEDVRVGGDWYDVIPLPDGRVGLAIGDVAGHGIVAAATMGQMRMALRAYAVEGLEPSQAIARLDALLTQLHPNEMTTLVYGHFDPRTGRATLARAAHPPPLLVEASGEVSFIGGGFTPPLGVGHRGTHPDVEVDLSPGATLLLYTDGLIDRRGESIDAGLARLVQAAATAPGDLEPATDYLIRTLLPGGSEDDTAILALRRRRFTGHPIVLDFPAEAAKIADIRYVLRRWLAANGIHGQVAQEAIVACSEACANAVQHPYGARQGSVRIGAKLEDDTLVLTVRDYGTWRPGQPRSGYERGRGTDLMRKLMDSIEISTGTQGTEVEMRRNIRGTR